MKPLQFVIMLICTLLASCTSFKKEKPNVVLTDKQMVAILTDIHLIEASLNEKQRSVAYNIDSSKIYTYSAYQQLFEKYGITNDDWQKNLYNAVLDSKKFITLYDRTIENLKEIDSLAQVKSNVHRNVN
ncbi:hypothetical protein FACS1894201_04450 [Bacteroidia bacterium]|nr:hypothetical protein FACS1894201_04450 [Bacteroidia bacterium]